MEPIAPAGEQPPRAAREAAISKLVGWLVGEYLGDEPNTRIHLNGDVITVVVEDTLTKGEERLVRARGPSPARDSCRRESG